MPDRSDTQLLEQLKKGSAAGVARWFKEYHQSLFMFIRLKIDNDHDAEELVQETFINCLKHLQLFRGDSSIKTWMQGVARHEVADYYRKKYAKKAILALPLNELFPHEQLENAHELSEKVTEVISHMSDKSRELLLLKYIDNKKIEEIAGEMKKSIKSIESDLFRARREFKELFAQRS